MATTDRPFSSDYLEGHEFIEQEKVCSAGRYGFINTKCEFFTINEFVHGNRSDFIAPTDT
jgi:hypothetical protein